MSDLGITKFVHRDNIGRYRKILRTYLTETERQFVERRLAEEEEALRDIVEASGVSFVHSHAA